MRCPECGYTVHESTRCPSCKKAWLEDEAIAENKRLQAEVGRLNKIADDLIQMAKRHDEYVINSEEAYSAMTARCKAAEDYANQMDLYHGGECSWDDVIEKLELWLTLKNKEVGK